MPQRPDDLGPTLGVGPAGCREDTSVPPTVLVTPETLTHVPAPDPDATRTGHGNPHVPGRRYAGTIPGLRGPRRAGPRRHGRRLQGPARRRSNRLVALKMILAGAARQAEGPGPVPGRGRGGRPAPAPEHRPGLRGRRARRAAVLLAGVRAPAAAWRRKLAGDAAGPAVRRRRRSRPLARAMQYAHDARRRPPRPQAGQHPARPTTGTPKITDFGLAKRLDDGRGPDADRARSSARPSYMAPEQAGGQTTKVGPADRRVRPRGHPLRAADRPPAVRRVERARHPGAWSAPASRSRRAASTGGCPRDLETICLKCLEKDPARRYADGRARWPTTCGGSWTAGRSWPARSGPASGPGGGPGGTRGGRPRVGRRPAPGDRGRGHVGPVVQPGGQEEGGGGHGPPRGGGQAGGPDPGAERPRPSRRTPSGPGRRAGGPVHRRRAAEARPGHGPRRPPAGGRADEGRTSGWSPSGWTSSARCSRTWT